MHHFRRHPLALAALLGAQALAQAQTQTTELPAVVITGKPIVEANRVDAFGSLTTEVTETQLRDLNAVDLSSALRRTPGVAVSRFNPVGSFGGDEGGAVYVRGLGASRPGSEIKTYVDGVPFYMGVWNHPLLDLLPVQGMQTISVYKGPQPQVVGNTFAAIDLVPKRAKKDGLQGDVTLSAGSHSTVVEQAALQLRQGDFDAALAQGFARSSGHRDDADGRLSNVMGRLGYRLTPAWSVGLTFLYGDNKVGDPGVEGQPATKTGRYDTRGSLVALSLAHQHGGVQGSLKLYTNSGVGLWHHNPNGADVRSTFDMSGLRWREQLAPWAGGELVAGWDVDQMSGTVAFNGFTAYDSETLRLNSPYAALSHTLALGSGWQLTPSAGARYYRHSVYGGSTAPHAGLVLQQGETLALRLNAARGLNHPGLDAGLLNAIVPPLAGAPTSWRNLNPERMDHLEAGLRWAPSAGAVLDVALFRDQLKDRYVFAFPPAVSLPSFTNLGNYSVRGAELSWQQALGRQLQLYASATLLDASVADLPYAPQRAGTLGLTWRQGPWRLSADAQAQSGMSVLNRARADGAPNTARSSGFGVLNLRTAYALPALGPRGEVFLALENLTDRAYGYRPGYPMPGRSAQLGLSLSL